MEKSALGNRMKNYEAVTDIKLVNGVPVIIRLDGRAFHTFTKGLKKPFDEMFSDCMQETMKGLCAMISNCVFGYTQSDEITLVLIDNKSGKSMPWFDNRLCKIITASATMATTLFNKVWHEKAINSFDGEYLADKVFSATFDARAFNIPKEDVVNNLIWRQKDATKNSINLVAQAHFSHKELQGKNGSQLQDMLMLEKGINWNDTPTKYKRGSACVRRSVVVNTPHGDVIRNRWIIDNEIPIFTQDRNYVNRELEVEYGNDNGND